MRYLLLVLWTLLWPVPSALAQVSIGIGLPGVSIGINLPLYPEMVQVPDYPVYYAPRLNSNYFFFDGMYWVYQNDNWYASSWFNGPWGLVPREVVPLFVLRIPVRYYRNPPEYFRGWWSDAPPRWGEHWGGEWEQHRSGWDRWNRSSAPMLAPLPSYQRQYTGDRYPQAGQQQAIHSQNYRYQPRDGVVQQHYQEQAATPDRNIREQERQRTSPQPQRGAVQRDARPAPSSAESVPLSRQASQPAPSSAESVPLSRQASQPAPSSAESVPASRQAAQPQRGAVQREAQPAPSSAESVPASRQAAQPQRGAVQREQRAPPSSAESVPQATQAPPGRSRGQAQDREKGEERGQERNR